MEKNFDKWNKKKKNLDTSSKNVYFKAGEIWWCAVGINIGEESCGKGETFARPVLIIKKLSHTIFLGIPLTTQTKSGSWFVAIQVQRINRCALLYQVRMFSQNRLQRRIAVASKKDFAKVKQKLEKLLELCDYHQGS
jgi:mRNA interferase MazF